MAERNDEANDDKKLVVNGYLFDTEEEYRKALEEKKSIERLMKKVDLDKKELLVALYSGLVTQNKLSTVIGLEYLCRLRDVIVNKKFAKAAELPPIPTGAFKTEKAVGYKLYPVPYARYKVACIHYPRSYTPAVTDTVGK